MNEMKELGTEFNEISKLFFEILAEARYILKKSEFQTLKTIMKELKTFHEQEIECLERIKTIQREFLSLGP